MKKRQSLTGDTIVVRNDDWLTAEVDGELMAMSVEKGTCYGLNGVGTRIWSLIEGPRSIDSLCDQLLAEFEVEEAVCRRDVFDLLEDFRAERLIRVEAH